MDYLQNLIKKYEGRLKNSNENMKWLNQELEKNDGSYPDIEFGQEYESEEATQCWLDIFLKDLKQLEKELEKNTFDKIEGEIDLEM